MKPIVDLVIPTFEEEVYLPKCLDTVIKQTIYNRMNVIIADYNPNNKQGVENICKEYGVNYVRINKRGIGYGRDIGIKHGRAPIISSMDADAKYRENNAIERLITPIIKEKKVLTCCSNIMDTGDVRDDKTLQLGSLLYIARSLLSEITLGYEPGLTLLRSVYNDVGGFPDSEYAEGMILDLKVLLKYGLSQRKYLNDLSIIVSSRRVNKMLDKGYGVFLDYSTAYRGDKRVDFK